MVGVVVRQDDFTYSVWVQSVGADVLKRPTGIARDPETGTIYVADTPEHNIKRFDATSRPVVPPRLN